MKDTSASHKADNHARSKSKRCRSSSPLYDRLSKKHASSVPPDNHSSSSEESDSAAMLSPSEESMSDTAPSQVSRSSTIGNVHSSTRTRSRRHLRSDATPPMEPISQATPPMVPCSHPSDEHITDDEGGHASQHPEESGIQCTSTFIRSSLSNDGGRADGEGHASQHPEESEVQDVDKEEDEEEETVIPAIEARISYIETEIANLRKSRPSAKAVWNDAQRSKEKAEKVHSQAVEEVDLSRKALHTNYRGKHWTQEDHDKFLVKRRRAEREYHRENARVARKHVSFSRVGDEIREWQDNMSELEKLKEERIALNEKEGDMVKQWVIIRDRQEEIKQLVQMY